MSDLWSFLLQTLTASLAALLLLGLKAVFADKLSPRWQYGVWSILALRLLLPAGLGGRQLSLSLAKGLEYLRFRVEAGLDSALTDLWAPIHVSAPVPLPSLTPPRSVTDLLFFLYVAGVVGLGLWYLICYGRLRSSLRTPAGPEQRGQVERVCLRYGLLPPVRVVVSPKVEAAFVCGPLRPVLVLPVGREVDDKVLLHELLHLKYGDLWLNTMVCLFRCLHWCNPFLWYVFNRVGNDGEALCDQRVLERLEGEERRDYGRILLNMAGGRYARAPFTSSLANGGRNISARIRAIARFKRFPQGMALVSLCMGTALCVACLWGTTASAIEVAPADSGDSLARSMAYAQVCRPSTLAGALDTYAKGILEDNGIYLAAVSDGMEQEQLYQRMARHLEADSGAPYFFLDTWGTGVPRQAQSLPGFVLGENCYYILNLTERAGGYDGWIAFSCQWGSGPDGEAVADKLLLHRVTVTREDPYGWVVRRTEERWVDYAPEDSGDAVYSLPGVEYAVETPEWRFSCRWVQGLSVDHVEDSVDDVFGYRSGGVNTIPKPQAEFAQMDYSYIGVLTLIGSGEEHPVSVSVQKLFELPKEPPEPTATQSPLPQGMYSYTSSSGRWGFADTTWEGRARGGGGGSGGPEDTTLPAALELYVQVEETRYGPYLLTGEVTE